MKKIFCFILAMLMILPLVACNNVPDDIEDTETSAAEESTEAASVAGIEKYDGIFQVGYSRIDITPETPIPLNTGDLLTKVKEPLYATCVAVYDGKTTALLFSLDVKNIGAGEDANLKNRIKAATKVPVKNIMINAMHNHSAPCVGTPGNDPAIQRWTAKLYSLVANVAKEAIADLSDAKMYMGTAKTTNIAFVRRYIHEDGSFSSIHYRGASSTPIVAHESEADDTAQIIRFVREDKKDVLITNWQAHVAHAIANIGNIVSADYVHYIREDIEAADDDTLVAFFCGASGNINETVKISKLNVAHGNYKRVGQAVAKAIIKQLDKLEPIQEGRIITDTTNYDAQYRKVDDDYVTKAKEIVASGPVGSAEYNAGLDKYGFRSNYEVDRVIGLSNEKAESVSLLFGAISIGDLAFISVPYEMFDTNGMEVKDTSPFKMTFILSMAGGCYGYVPSALAVENGGYEVYQSIFEYGTAEKAVAVFLDMLKEQYEDRKAK